MLGAILALLVASVPSFRLIPFGPFWGLDLQNLHAFHSCVGRNDPYLVSGAQCGDSYSRDMYYPPALYWSFAWLRLVMLQTGVVIWAIVIVLGTLGALIAWLPPRMPRPWRAVFGLFLALLLAQYPLAFAVERGNNDVIVLVAWTLAMRLWLAGSRTASGFVAGAAIALKLYPIFACTVIAVGLAVNAVRDRASRRAVAAFAAGGAAATALALALLHEQTMYYVTHQLAYFATLEAPAAVFSHTLPPLAPAWNGWLLKAPLLLAWGAAATRLLRRDPILVFAGALAITTYFASVSYDYNLLTTYPILLVLFSRTLGSGRVRLVAFGLLMLGLVAVIGNRAVFAGGMTAMKVHVFVQWAWLVATGFLSGHLAQCQPVGSGDRIATSHPRSPDRERLRTAPRALPS
jgi:hypothetical protein